MTRVAAIILAAGASTRLGTPKQLALLAGETLLARAIRIAAETGCAPILTVLGANAETIQARCSLHPTCVVLNDGWSEGMAASVRAGVQALTEQVTGTILMTCDQPAVTPEHLRSLAARNPEQTIASSYAGRRGVPAYFPARLFPRLLALTGDLGARHLLACAEALDLPGGDLDVDTPESFAVARTLYEQPQPTPS